jgi:hypothetical protein
MIESTKRKFQSSKQENVLPLPFVNPVSKVPFQWHNVKVNSIGVAAIKNPVP